MATDADIDLMEPVIVSSDRFKDIEPYCNKLYFSDEMRWKSIMPFDFPANGTKAEEETFLRKFFSEREIRMQGGANGDGNGFKFLKQVWHCLAVFNQYDRVPQISTKWIEANQNLLNDPGMRRFVLDPGCKPLTFFSELELAMHGEKLLGHVVQDIQGKVAPPEQSLEYQRKISQTSRPKTASPPDTAVESSATFFPPGQPKRFKAEPNDSVVASIEPKSSPINMPSTQAPTATPQERNFSSNVPHTLEPPHPTIHQRAPQQPSPAMRNTSSGYAPPHQAYSPQDARFHPQQNQTQSAEMPRAAPNAPPGPAFQPRGYPAPFVPAYAEIGPPMHPQNYADSPYHQFDNGQAVYPPYTQHPQHAPTGFIGYPASTQGQKKPHAPPPFGDRSNLPAESRTFSNPQYLADWAGYPDDQRRDSVMSTRGYNSYRGQAGRFKGKRGKNGSFGQGNTYRPPHVQELFNPYDSAEDKSRFNSPHQAFTRSTTQHQHLRDENANPTATGSKFSARQNVTRFTTDDVYPANVAPYSGVNQVTSDHPQHHRRPSTFESYVPCGCTKYAIGTDCTSANQLIVFGVPVTTSLADVGAWFAQFGEVVDIYSKAQYTSQHPAQEHFQMFHVRLSDVDSARRALSQRHGSWIGGPHFMVENAQNHYDPDRRFIARKLSHNHGYNMPVLGPSAISAPPGFADHHQDRHLSDAPRPAFDSDAPAELGADALSGGVVASNPAPHGGTIKKHKSKNQKTGKKTGNSKADRKDSGPSEVILHKAAESKNSLPAIDATTAEATPVADAVGNAELAKITSMSEKGEGNKKEGSVIKSAGETAAAHSDTPHISNDAKTQDINAVPEFSSERSELADVKAVEDDDAATVQQHKAEITFDNEVKTSNVEKTSTEVAPAPPSPGSKTTSMSEDINDTLDSKAETPGVDNSVFTPNDQPAADISKTLETDAAPSGSTDNACSATTEVFELQASPHPEANNETSPGSPAQVEPVSPKTVDDADDAKSAQSEKGDKQAVSRSASPDTPKAALSEVRKHSTAVAVPSAQALASRSTPSLSKAGGDPAEVASKISTQADDLQRTISQSSALEDSAAGFVTAPSTPMIGDPTPEVKSKKQLKKELKEKGPAKTESLSLFSKPNKKKLPKKGGSVRGRSLAMTTLSENSRSVSATTETHSSQKLQSFAEVKIEQKSDKSGAADQPVEKGGGVLNTMKDNTENNKTSKSAGKAKLQEEKAQISTPKDDSVSAPASPARGVIGTMKAYLGLGQSPKSTKKPNEATPDDVPSITLNEGVGATAAPDTKSDHAHEQQDANMSESVPGLGISDLGIDPFPAAGSSPGDGESKPKKKKKKSKARNKQGNATAELTQMGHAVNDSIDPTVTPIHEYLGKDVVSGEVEVVDRQQGGNSAMGPPRLPRQAQRGYRAIGDDDADSDETESGVTQIFAINEKDVVKTSESSFDALLYTTIPKGQTLFLRTARKAAREEPPETPVKTIEGAPDVQEVSPEVEKSKQKLREMEKREEEMKRAAKNKSA
ncbi:unnamed protein product [Zymoseptoria tritici ST99CH_3D7]|uniref:RRM domain-containing protein n=1 Tax=Zymoseptoria tritici (strain ST99CH_3D7) TaxID=1276538 RepID=A0A1X7REP3_ZYMT9|nr:unnamed protein product [Zymoseptoria tritici ST99CH_3D7]